MRRALGILAAALLVAAATACGDDDSGSGSDAPTQTSGATAFPDEQAYFDEMVAVFEGIHSEAETIRAELQTGLASSSSDERSAAIAAYADSYTTYGMNAQAQLSAIKPPGSASAQHSALAAAALDLQQLGEALNAAVELNPPSDEAGFNNAYFEIDGSALEQRFRDACVDLQTLASSKGVEADYQCTR